MKKIINKCLTIYKKYQEAIDYLFWGGVAFVLSMLLFWIFNSLLGWNSVVANTVDWIICVLFTYFTNRTFVFKSKLTNKIDKIKEFIEFVLARLFTLLLEDLIIYIGIDCIINSPDPPVIQSMIVKLIGQFVVIVTNYILSKLWIFKKKAEKTDGNKESDNQ